MIIDNNSPRAIDDFWNNLDHIPELDDDLLYSDDNTCDETDDELDDINNTNEIDDAGMMYTNLMLKTIHDRQIFISKCKKIIIYVIARCLVSATIMAGILLITTDCLFHKSYPELGIFLVVAFGMIIRDIDIVYFSLTIDIKNRSF